MNELKFGRKLNAAETELTDIIVYYDNLIDFMHDNFSGSCNIATLEQAAGHFNDVQDMNYIEVTHIDSYNNNGTLIDFLVSAYKNYFGCTDKTLYYVLSEYCYPNLYLIDNKLYEINWL